MSSAAPTAAAPVRVMLVDDYQVVRDGLRAALGRENDMTIVGEAASADEAVRVARKCRPEVVVMDVRLGGSSGIKATRDIRSDDPNVRVLMLTSFADDEALLASVVAGASGFVLKQIRLDGLISAIHAVAAGETLISESETRGVVSRLKRGKHLHRDRRLATLTGQEERVLELIADGLTNRQISQTLGLTEKTVKNYLSNIFGKLEVQRRAGAAAYFARRQGNDG
jgi:two-component system, NarL family, response regulator DevR